MVATRLYYRLTNGTNYLNIPRDLSEYHRKLHRAKNIYTVYGGFIRDNGSCSAKFAVAPNTWQSRSAVNRTFKIWRKMVSQTLSKNEGLKSGKWNDFKMLLDDSMSSGNTKPGLDANGVAMAPGEWDYSTLTQPRLVDPDGDGGLEYDADADQWEVHIVGNHGGEAPDFTRIGMIKSWTDSKAPVQSSGEPSNILNPLDPLANMFEVEDDDEEKVTIIMNEGDLPPYDRDEPFGIKDGAFQAVGTADNGANASITPVGNMVPGFQALCGLVRVVVSTNSDNVELWIDVESQGESF